MERTFRVGKKEVKVKETALDRVIGYWAPQRAERRLRSRIHLALAGGYVAGSRSKRSLAEFTPNSGSANADQLPEMDTMRARSRDMARNSPIACGAINTNVTSVIGPGLKMKPAIDRKTLGMTDEQAEAWEYKAEFLWRMWSESVECDATRTQNFLQLQGLVYRSVLESGDIFSLLPSIERTGSPFRLKVQLIEADRVENENFRADTPNMAGGIEFDESGAPVRYHIMKHHPGDSYARAREWQKVRAYGSRSGRRQVIHVYDKIRPGQARGVPYLAPVIDALKQLTDYTDAELTAAIVSGLFTVFIKSEHGDGNFDLTEVETETGGSSSDDDLKLGAGAVGYLGEGEDVTTANPNRPNDSFDPFVMAILRQIGVALELPFELVVKHFTASYSASRAALLEAWRFFKRRRAWIASAFCQPVYEAFITEQVARGRISAPGFLRDPVRRAAFLRAEWIGRPAGHIQPLQEAKAADQRVITGISTLTKEAMEYDGSDWEALHRQRAREQRMRKEDGLSGAQGAAGGGNGQPETDPNPEDTSSAGQDNET